MTRKNDPKVALDIEQREKEEGQRKRLEESTREPFDTRKRLLDLMPEIITVKKAQGKLKREKKELEAAQQKEEKLRAEIKALYEKIENLQQKVKNLGESNAEHATNQVYKERISNFDDALIARSQGGSNKNLSVKIERPISPTSIAARGNSPTNSR